MKISTWILIAAWFVAVMGFVSGEAEEVLCNRIEVVLSDTLHSRFVTREEIYDMLERTGLPLQGYPLSEIDTRSLEGHLEENPYIRNAEICKDITGKLEVQVEQRLPLVRIMPEGREGFYLDREGYLIPLSDRFTPHILLATGNIPEPEISGEPGDRIEEIFLFSRYLTVHPFWKTQIVQIYVDEDGNYELIPRVGAHRIILGSMEAWQKKLNNLELLYRQGFSRQGWNNYELINLKYTNQVICTKR